MNFSSTVLGLCIIFIIYLGYVTCFNQDAVSIRFNNEFQVGQPLPRGHAYTVATSKKHSATRLLLFNDKILGGNGIIYVIETVNDTIVFIQKYRQPNK